MGIFSSYLMNLLAVCVCACVCEEILSGTSRSGKTLENGLKLVISLCVVISVIIPTSHLFKELDAKKMSKAEKTSVSDGYLLALTKKELESNLNEKIYLSFGIQPLYSCIDFDIEEGKECTVVDFSSAKVALSTSDKTKGEEVRKFTSELLGCEVNIITDGENNYGKQN